METGKKPLTGATPSSYMIIWWTFILISLILLFQQQYLISTTLLLALVFLRIIIRFERSATSTRGIVMLAILTAVASVSRIPFAFIPNVQPATFVVIISGIVFGKESGFMVGALTALVSNIFLGQGPWTPWQMLAWGMIGFCAGLLKNSWLIKSTAGQVLYGILSAFVFGWIMNLWVVLTVLQEFHWGEILFIYGSSFLFDLAHALANVFFLLLFSKSWIRTLSRFQKKYDVFV